MATADYGSTDLKDLEAIKPNKKEKRPPTSSLIVVLLQGVMQVGGFTAIIPTATMYVKAVGGSARVDARARVSVTSPPLSFIFIGEADGRRMLMLPRGSPGVLF